MGDAEETVHQTDQDVTHQPRVFVHTTLISNNIRNTVTGKIRQTDKTELVKMFLNLMKSSLLLSGLILHSNHSRILILNGVVVMNRQTQSLDSLAGSPCFTHRRTPSHTIT